jgi:hypothetical protein
MNKANKLFVALALGLSAAAFGTQAAAEQSQAARDAAIHRCSVQAQRQNPGTAAAEDQARTEAYMACMRAAGFTP